MRIRLPKTRTITCFPTIRSFRFGMSIHETSLLRSTLWPVPHWCCGEYNTPRLPIARCCWTCREELLRLRTARCSDGITNVRGAHERRTKMVFSSTLIAHPAETQPHDTWKQ